VTAKLKLNKKELSLALPRHSAMTTTILPRGRRLTILS